MCCYSTGVRDGKYKGLIINSAQHLSNTEKKKSPQFCDQGQKNEVRRRTVLFLLLGKTMPLASVLSFYGENFGGREAQRPRLSEEGSARKTLIYETNIASALRINGIQLAHLAIREPSQD